MSGAGENLRDEVRNRYNQTTPVPTNLVAGLEIAGDDRWGYCRSRFEASLTLHLLKAVELIAQQDSA